MHYRSVKYLFTDFLHQLRIFFKTAIFHSCAISSGDKVEKDMTVAVVVVKKDMGKFLRHKVIQGIFEFFINSVGLVCLRSFYIF